MQGMRVQLALQSLKFYLPAQLMSYVYLVLTLLVLVGPRAVRPDLESNVPTNQPEKVGGFRSWNFTSFVSEKGMQWTCS